MIAEGQDVAASAPVQDANDDGTAQLSAGGQGDAH